MGHRGIGQRVLHSHFASPSINYSCLTCKKKVCRGEGLITGSTSERRHAGKGMLFARESRSTAFQMERDFTDYLVYTTHF